MCIVMAWCFGRKKEIQILTERERERMEKRKGRKIRGNEMDRERKKE